MNNTVPVLPPQVRMQEILFGFGLAQALYVVAELNISTALLDGPRSVEQLAAESNADSGALRRIIRYLTSYDVFRLRGDRVEVTDLGRTLADGVPGSVRGLARYWMETHYQPFSDLVHTARTGETAATHYLGKPMFDWVNESARLTQLQNSAMSGGGKVARGDLLERYELPDGEVVADIGGADGSLLAELLADRPQRRGVLFDLPAVISDAPVRLSAAGLADRVDVVGGDFFDSVPAADIYVMSVVLHDWDDDSCVRILNNIAASATPGARLVLIEAVVPEDGQPHFSKLLDLVMLAMLTGRERSESEWRELLAKGGFALDRIVNGSGAMSAIEASRI
ncbi:methyltransferase [Kibdelosporangium aridum]|uniref:methyltransferase n=1 Tax=Kibdelosporangium aridum TaxID=2030 RepID=UPI0035EBCDD9